MHTDLQVTVVYPDPARGRTHTVSESIGWPYVEQFMPVDVCTDPLGAMMSRNGKTLSQMHRVTQQRRELAKELAETLTEALLKAMEANDTVNGYPKDEGSRDRIMRQRTDKDRPRLW